MKKLIASIFSIGLAVAVNAQCGPVPPPPGVNPFYMVDADNDGFAQFDMVYFINSFERPLMEEYHQVSSSGYDFVFHNSEDEIITEQFYTNIIANEEGMIYYNYTGSGPVFSPMPPCFWPPALGGGVVLRALPFNGDFDNDGIVNADEDSNGNLNLMDDDSDGDGNINVIDTSNVLSVASNQLIDVRIYPNPVVGGIIFIDAVNMIGEIAISDISGKVILNVALPQNQINVSALTSGIYFIRILSAGISTVKKIVI